MNSRQFDESSALVFYDDQGDIVYKFFFVTIRGGKHPDPTERENTGKRLIATVKRPNQVDLLVLHVDAEELGKDRAKFKVNLRTKVLERL